MYYISGQVSDLMFTISLLRKRIKELESGEAMVAMQSHYKQALAAVIRRNHVLEKEKAHLYILLEKMQEKWFLTCDDLYQEILDVEKTHKAEIARMQEKIWEAERQRDAALDKAKERAQELYIRERYDGRIDGAIGTSLGSSFVGQLIQRQNVLMKRLKL